MALFLQEELEFKDVASALRQKTDYNSVVFSPHMEIPKLPPQLLAFSMKRVYKVESLEEILSFLKQNLEIKSQIFTLSCSTIKRINSLTN